MSKYKYCASFKQQGLATITILLLVGVSVSVAVFGAFRYVQSSQSQTMAFHAQTQAQRKAWSGVSMLNQYFINFNHLSPKPSFDDLITALTVASNNNENLLSSVNGLHAQVQAIESVDDIFNVTANVTGTTDKDTRAEASSTIQVVFSLRDTSAGNAEGEQCTEVCSPRALDLIGDLNVSGDIKFHTEGEQYEINVDGNVTLGGLSTGGIDKIRSTKSIKFVGGSSTDFEEMHANCDIQVGSGNFTVKNIKATRNVCLANTINSQRIVANASVDIFGGNHGDIYAHANKPTGTATCSSGAIKHCESAGERLASTFGVKTNPTPTIESIFSRNIVHLNSSANVDKISAEGALIITGCSPRWNSAIFGGAFSNNSSCPQNATFYNGPWAFPVPAVTPLALDKEVFDVNALKSSANYIYYRDSSDRTRVKVRGIDGIPDSSDSSNPLDVQEGGYYYRQANILDPNDTGWKNRTVAGYICKNNNPPSRDDEFGAKYCLVQLGNAFNNSTFLPAYSNNGKWTMNGVSHAPGVVFFEGDLDIGSGTYTNTFIATGNIHVMSSGNSVFSLNYAGFSGVTENYKTAMGVCDNDEYSAKPADFCQGGSYNYDAFQGIGNYALLAGSCPEAGCITDSDGKISGYIGGDIKIENSVYGIIKAGNYISTGGATKIYGTITSLAQSSAPSNHALGNSTEFFIREPNNSGYNPLQCKDECTPPPSASADIETKVLWSRYL